MPGPCFQDAWDPAPFINPSPGSNWYKHTLEHIDARHEPIGWRDTIGAGPPTGFGKATVLVAANSVKKLNPKMARPMYLYYLFNDLVLRGDYFLARVFPNALSTHATHAV